MTSRRQRIGATFLVSTLVLFVLAGGIALAGNSTTASVTEAIEYGGDIELALDSNTGSPIQDGNVDVWVDGNKRSVSVAVDGTDGRVVLTGLDDVHEHQTLTVQVQQSGDLETDEISVTVTGAVLNAGGSRNTFPGTDVAYVASDVDETFSITRDGSFIAERGTGPNSRLYVVDTDDQEIGPTYYVNESSGISSSYRLRDLDLTAEASTTDGSEGDSITVSVSSNGASRPFEARLVDVDSGDVVTSKIAEMGSNGDGSVEFGDLSAGTYEVRIEDIDSGITTSTDRISVGSTGDGTVEFDQTVMEDERGDVVAIPIVLSGDAAGGSTDVILGDGDVNFQVSLTVEDSDGDGSAVVYWNTMRSDNATGGVWVGDGTLQGSISVDIAVDNPVTTGDYPVTVAYGGEETDIATLRVQERSTDGVTVLTAPDESSERDVRRSVASTAADDTVALDELTLEHDWLIVRIEASGLGGYVHSVGDVDGANGLSLTIEQSEDSLDANEDPVAIDVQDGMLIPDSGNDRYYVAFDGKFAFSGADAGDEFDVTFVVDGSGNAVTDGTESVTTSFTLINGTASIDTEGGTLTVENSPDATVTGGSTFAPGTELTVTLRREGGDSPFVTDDTVAVQSDGTWSASFDLSDRPEGQTFNAMVSKGDEGRASVQGEVVAGDAAPTTTNDAPTGDGSDGTEPAGATDTEPATEFQGTGDGVTPTSTPAPGFGVLVGMAASLVTIVLLRRD